MFVLCCSTCVVPCSLFVVCFGLLFVLRGASLYDVNCCCSLFVVPCLLFVVCSCCSLFAVCCLMVFVVCCLFVVVRCVGVWCSLFGVC